MKKLIIFFMSLFVAAHSWAVTEFDSEDQLVLKVIPTVMFSNQQNQFIYSYQITNEQGPENLKHFEVESGDGKVTNLQGPKNLNWSKGFVIKAGSSVPLNFLGFTISWAVHDPKPDYAHLFIEGPSTLKPGQSITVQFQSKGLPGIHRFWGEGWVPPPNEADLVQFFSQKAGKQFTNLDEVPKSISDQLPYFKPWFVDAFQGQTVTPENPQNANLQPNALVQRLIGLKEKALSLGWIDNDGVAKSLDQKLANALDDLKKGDTSAASGILGAFVNELDAQRGKHVNDSAFSLLKANAQFILAKLNT